MAIVYPDLHVPDQGALSNLGNWIANDLAAPVVKLYSSNTLYSPVNTPASYTEASFPGYMSGTPTVWSAPVINTSGKAESRLEPVVFRLNSNSGIYICYGIYVTDLANAKLLLVFPFVQPVSFTSVARSFPFQIVLTSVTEL